MNRIMFFSVVIAMSVMSMPVFLRSQTNSSPQWYKAPSTEFANTSVYETQSDFGGSHYEASVFGRDLDGVPKWKVGKELPTGMPTIIANAGRAFQKAFPQLKQFKMISVNLVHLPAVDDWVFDVEFNGTDFTQLGMGSYEDKKINVVVLLNGRVITPVETAK
jgi:hypothetical protein